MIWTINVAASEKLIISSRYPCFFLKELSNSGSLRRGSSNAQIIILSWALTTKTPLTRPIRLILPGNGIQSWKLRHLVVRYQSKWSHISKPDSAIWGTYWWESRDSHRERKKSQYNPVKQRHLFYSCVLGDFQLSIFIWPATKCSLTR